MFFLALLLRSSIIPNKSLIITISFSKASPLRGMDMITWSTDGQITDRKLLNHFSEAIDLLPSPSAFIK